MHSLCNKCAQSCVAPELCTHCCIMIHVHAKLVLMHAQSPSSRSAGATEQACSVSQSLHGASHMQVSSEVQCTCSKTNGCLCSKTNASGMLQQVWFTCTKDQHHMLQNHWHLACTSMSQHIDICHSVHEHVCVCVCAPEWCTHCCIMMHVHTELVLMHLHIYSNFLHIITANVQVHSWTLWQHQQTLTSQCYQVSCILLCTGSFAVKYYVHTAVSWSYQCTSWIGTHAYSVTVHEHCIFLSCTWSQPVFQYIHVHCNNTCFKLIVTGMYTLLHPDHNSAHPELALMYARCTHLPGSCTWSQPMPQVHP